MKYVFANAEAMRILDNHKADIQMDWDTNEKSESTTTVLKSKAITPTSALVPDEKTGVNLRSGSASVTTEISKTVASFAVPERMVSGGLLNRSGLSPGPLLQPTFQLRRSPSPIRINPFVGASAGATPGTGPAHDVSATNEAVS